MSASPQSPMTTTPHILIVGAGLGGLALAQGLNKHGAGRVSFALYERDPSADARAQGYHIKIFPDTLPDLQQLLPETLVQDYFEATMAETVMTETCVNAISGQVTARRALRGPKPHTVDRGFLRKVILSGLDEHIHWGKTFTHYEVSNSNPDGGAEQVTAFFSDGTSETGTLLVGADGGRSLIRRQHLREINKQHTIIDPEAVCIYGRTHLTPELESRLQPSLLLGGLAIVRDVAPPIQYIIFDSELPISMFVERMHFPAATTDNDSNNKTDGGSAAAHADIARRLREEMGIHLPEKDYMYWSMLAPTKALGCFTEDAVSSLLASATPREIAERLVTGEWHDSTRCLVEMQDDSYAAALRVISCVPGDFEDDDQPPAGSPGMEGRVVTLMGDAAHVMSPSGGVGAATALRDAVLLTRALVQELGGDGRGNVESAVRGYEVEMRRAAKVAVERSFRGGEILYGQPPLEKCRVLDNV